MSQWSQATAERLCSITRERVKALHAERPWDAEDERFERAQDECQAAFEENDLDQLRAALGRLETLALHLAGKRRRKVA